VVAYHLLIRLEGLLILQSAQGPVDREKVLNVLVFAGCGEGHPVSLQLHLGLHKFGRTLTELIDGGGENARPRETHS
jgi:hypothetical protein